MISLLYVDDERDLLEICRLFLENFGDFSVNTVDSADGALHELKKGAFDAIVSDYQMPHKDGIAFLKEVREHFGSIPFILFTGRGREEVVIEAINNGADFYLQKGGDPRAQFTELAHKVRQATSRKKAQDELQAAYEQMAADEEELRQQYEDLAKGEQLLHESRELMRTFMDSATDAFTIYDANLNLIDINRAALEYLPEGTTKDDVLKKNLKEFISGADDWGELERYRDVIRTGIPMSGKMKAPESRFGRHWMDVKVFRVGSGLGIVTSDITREKEAQDNLKKSEEQSRRVLEKMPLPLALVRDDGTVAFINDRLTEVFGYSREDLPTLASWWERAYPDPAYRTQVRQQWEADLKVSAEKNEDIRSVEYTITCKNGEKRFVEISGITIPDGFLATFIDHTERKKAEDTLRQSEEQLRLFIQQTPAALAMFDTEMRYLAASRRWITDYHLGEREILGRSHYEIFPELSDAIREIHRRSMAGEVIASEADRFERQDGTVQWVSWEARPWYTTENRIGGIIILSEDITGRRQAEAALRESERNYRTIVENSQSIIYTLTPTGTFSFVSPSWKTNLGHDPAEVLGRHFREFIHPEDLPRCEEFVATSVSSGAAQTSRNDYRIFHKDGTVHWHRSSIVPIFDAAGSLVSIVGNAVDLTDRKLAEDALAESRVELASILHGSPIPKFVIGLDHRIVSWNRALEKYTGVSEQEMIGTDRQWQPFYPGKRPVLADLLVDNNTDGLYKWYGGKLKPSPYIEGAYEAVDFFPTVGPDGTYLSFTAAPIRDAKGRIIGAVETLEDVSGRVAAADALKKSEKMYRHILENMQDAYIRTDKNGIIVMVNPAAARMYGYGSAEEMIGIPSSTLYSGGSEMRERVLKNLHNAGGIYDFSGNAIRKDGIVFPASLNIQFTKDDSGGITGAEGIVRDISERIAMEQAIRESNRKLGLLNSITRHDLANQLTMLQGFVQLARERSHDPEVSRYLSRIEEGFLAVHRQIDFLKTYQELGVPPPAWFRLDEIITREKTPELTVSGSCNKVEIFADPMLEKVFRNLFDNAIRHGGHTVQITVQCEAENETLAVIVEDNGTGIPEGEKERIFEKGVGKNTGFGLFLAKEILAITGITLRETGTPGNGARFEILVPKGAWRSGTRAA